MASVTVDVLGLAELGERMRKLERAVALKIARRATSSGAAVFKKRAKQKLRTNPTIDTGLLEKNVVVRKSRSRLTSEHAAAVRVVNYPGRKGKFTTTSAVGSLMEYGTVKMNPEPFMRPAFDEGKDEALNVAVKEISDGIDKALA